MSAFERKADMARAMRSLLPNPLPGELFGGVRSDSAFYKPGTKPGTDRKSF
jgi:hypothetical protein